MKKLFQKWILGFFAFTSILCLASQQVKAQDKEGSEVGITEHLGDIIPLQLTFNNEQGKPVQLKDLINKPTILVLIYFDCPGICPQLLSGVSDVIEKSDMTLGQDFRIVTVSFNENDKPAQAIEKKRNFLRKKSLPYAKDWIYLTGDSAAIHTLTNLVGYHFKHTGNDFLHPVAIIILSPEGKITRYLYGTYFLPFDLKMAIVEAQKGQARPTINRMLEYCFSYDPEGRKYTLQVTKISATLIIFFAIVLFIYLIIRNRRKGTQTVQHNKSTEQKTDTPI
jgi:protein SCO1